MSGHVSCEYFKLTFLSGHTLEVYTYTYLKLAFSKCWQAMIREASTVEVQCKLVLTAVQIFEKVRFCVFNSESELKTHFLKILVFTNPHN